MNTKISRWIRYIWVHKVRQFHRLSHKWVALFYSFVGATLVAASAMLFAHMAEFALEWNTRLVKQFPWFAWVALPLGLPVILWFTRRFAPYTSGSGIPQVLASLALPYGQPKKRAVRFRETLYKIPLTFLGMLAGASIGREGPSVQVGAAVMASWGRWCRKRQLAFIGLQDNDLLAAGAAGGLAAAFNAPLAGVIFAIEELGRGVMLRWERKIFLCILMAGFVQVAMNGNNPYFYGFYGKPIENMLMWAVLGALICGVAGGLFARFLFKGVTWVVPKKSRAWVGNHPFIMAAILGVLLAAIGTLNSSDTYGTGYQQVSAALRGTYDAPVGVAVGKWLATVFSYWAGIPGGIFTPCLSIGAMIGQQLADLNQLGGASNVLVLLCMAGFLSGATQSPLTASVVVMEMTGSINLLIWLLLCSLIATVVSRQFCPKPFYHAASVRFRQRVMTECESK
ncbi:chloride channel protein [Kingella negevensis]|nr:chloride channel protein [Kingella negevensis]MDK4688393.1 chloride channel protein [Kingella negevensis]